jgi:hypothetical protein
MDAKHLFRSQLGWLVATLVTLVTLVMVVSPGLAQAAPPVTMSGAYVGAGDASALNSFVAFRGSSAPVVLDYLGNDAWSDISNPSWLLNEWSSYRSNGGQLVLSVPMLVNSPTGTLAAGASGAYDSYFESLGKQLVADGDGSIVLRLGWEMNGTTFPWSVTGANGDTSADFIAYWRHLVTLFRAIPGSHFTFNWTVNVGGGGATGAASYPGNAYVNSIGVDVYDRGWGPNGAPIADPVTRWNQLETEQYGLNWWAAFSQSHGVAISVPEWGLEYQSGWNGGGDDPYFINQMHAWMQTNHPAFESYFNYADSTINNGNTPQAAAAYKKDWGTSTTTTAPTTVRNGTLISASVKTPAKTAKRTTKASRLLLAHAASKHPTKKHTTRKTKKHSSKKHAAKKHSSKKHAAKKQS